MKRKVTQSMEARMIILARLGYSLECIVNALADYDVTTVCASTVTRYLRQHDLKLHAIRAGRTSDSATRLASAMKSLGFNVSEVPASYRRGKRPAMSRAA
jgi:hypothetical protein